jgi:hypothetical protein
MGIKPRPNRICFCSWLCYSFFLSIATRFVCVHWSNGKILVRVSSSCLLPSPMLTLRAHIQPQGHSRASTHFWTLVWAFSSGFRLGAPGTSSMSELALNMQCRNEPSGSMSSTSVVSLFPQELIDQVVEEYSYDPLTLRKSALASRAFLRPSQSWLFTNIGLTETRENCCLRLLDIPKQSPHVCGYIRSVNIDAGGWISEDHALISVPRMLHALTSFDFTTHAPEFQWKDLPSAFTAFSRVLDIEMPRASEAVLCMPICV